MKFFSKFILTCMLSTSVFAHYDTAYWNTGTRAQTRSGWMDWIPDNRRLSEMSIPGTHDSAAWHSNLIGLDSTRTQTMSIEDQLMSGIRALDLRIRYEGDKFSLYHGPIYLRQTLDETFATIRKFLKSNPTETVYIRMSQENSSASYNEIFNLFHDKYYSKYHDIFYTGDEQNPKLGDTRGKMVIMSDVGSLGFMAIVYRHRDHLIQDDYYIASNWDLYDKWEKIKKHINLSNSIINNTFINYITANGGSFPYFVASGHSSPGTHADRLSTGLTEPAFKHRYPDFPRGSRVGSLATIYFEGTNTLVADYIEKNKIVRTGIIMADFPGQRLINAIIEANKRFSWDNLNQEFTITN